MTQRLIALCYLRLSGRDIKEISIDIQKDECIRVCQRHGWKPIFLEEGEGRQGQFSARKRTNLAVWDALYQRALTDPSIAAIVTYDISRVFRRTEVALFAAEELGQIGVEFVSAADGTISVKTPEDKFSFTFKAAMAEYEAFKARTRLLGHYHKVKERKGYAGHKPQFGLDRSGSSKNETEVWTPDENFPHVLTLLRLYVTGHYGCNAIAKILYNEGIRWRNRSDEPSEQIYPATIRRLLLRLDLYAPHVDKEDPTLISQVRAMMQRRAQRKENHRALKTHSYLLRGVLFCAHCGRRYAQHAAPFKDGIRIKHYYAHMQIAHCVLGDRYYFQRDAIDDLFLVLLHRLHRKSPAEIQESFRAPDAPILPTPDYEQERQTLLKRLARFEDMYADGKMTEARYLEGVQRITAELANLPAPLPPPPEKPKQVSPDEWYATFQSHAHLLDAGRVLEPDLANAGIRELFSRVEWDGSQITTILGPDGQELFRAYSD